jgi:hypothetical protein
MPRVHTQKAAKAYPDQGIEKGAIYYKWSLRTSAYGRGTTYRSATYPKPWQLTSSPFLQEQYRIAHDLADVSGNSVDELESARDELADRIDELKDTCQESLDNMPEAFQYGSTGELLQERIDACESWADELREVDLPSEDVDEPDEIEEPDEEDEDYEEKLDLYNNYCDELEAYETFRSELEEAIDNLRGIDYPG